MYPLEKDILKKLLLKIGKLKSMVGGYNMLPVLLNTEVLNRNTGG
jgi:hypothetical protein